jgi:hypothetical protein
MTAVLVIASDIPARKSHPYTANLQLLLQAPPALDSRERNSTFLNTIHYCEEGDRRMSSANAVEQLQWHVESSSGVLQRLHPSGDRYLFVISCDE